MLRRRKRNEEVNLLDLIPQRTVDSNKREDGLTELVVPKFRNKYLKAFFRKRLEKPTWKVELDEIGTYVWDQVDGNTTVGEIGNSLEKKFGEKVEPVYDRLNRFFSLMIQHEFVCFINYPGKK